jgi:hypothetical protein
MASITQETLPEFLAIEEVVNLTCESAVVGGQLVVTGASSASSVRNPPNDATAEFAGIALQSGAVGDVIQVCRRGAIKTTINMTVDLTTAGTALYGDTSGTASNNPVDISNVSTNNLLVGRCGQVFATGAQGTNIVEVRFAYDGLPR